MVEVPFLLANSLVVLVASCMRRSAPECAPWAEIHKSVPTRE